MNVYLRLLITAALLYVFAEGFAAAAYLAGQPSNVAVLLAIIVFGTTLIFGGKLVGLLWRKEWKHFVAWLNSL